MHEWLGAFSVGHATAPNAWRFVFAFFVAIVLFGGLAFIVLKSFKGFRTAAERAQARAFAGIPTLARPAPGMVGVVFHTYYGVLVHTEQTEHRFWAKPDDARLVLRRLHHFNMVWGVTAHGAVLIPLLSIGNYVAQRRKIAKQAALFR